MVERGGTKLQDMFSSDPWKKKRCEREDCLPCKSKEDDTGGISCQTENINYTIKCKECLKGGERAEYLGESARTGFKRGAEHVEGLITENEKGPL